MSNIPHPINTTAPASASASDSQPISPITRTGTFPHKTSAAVSTATPYIETSMPPINQTPVEIDGTPTSPEELKRRDTAGTNNSEPPFSPDMEEEEAQREMGEGEGAGKVLREKRAALLASRSKDPAVLVDLPPGPNAEEVEAAKAGSGTVTPAPAGDEKILGKLKNLISR